MDIWQAVISLASGGLAGGCTSIVFTRRYYLRKLRTELYPQVETLVNAYHVRSLLPEGKGWIVDGKKFRPGPSDDEFRKNRIDFISRLVVFNELREARELRKKMLSSEFDPALADGFPLDVLEAESNAMSDCFKTLRRKLGLH